jgi:prepilin signal peptidase PulO-like enzyme (type II secretory pathway)
MTLFLLFPVGVWLVCRTVNWLPLSMARDESAWLTAVRSGQNPEPCSVWSKCKSFLASPPPVNAYSAIATIGIAVVVLGLELSQFSGLSLILWFLFGCVLVTLALVDFQTRLLPDMLTLPMIWLGLLIQLLPETRTVGLDWALIGAVAGYLPLWLLAQIYRLVRGRDGLGMGDLKLLAAIGAWSGPFILPMVLFLAAIFAIALFLIGPLCCGKTAVFHEEHPFGPWIVVAYGVVMLSGHPI